MRISILGPLEVEGDGGPVAVGGLRLRALLAVLALEAGRLVTAERLIDVLWPQEPPANAANALQTLVRRLRAALRPDEVIDSRPGGYALAAPAEQVDALAFRRLAGEDPERALALWRGAALADLTSVPYLADVATALEQERLAAVEARAERLLADGRPVELTAEVTAHPLRERLVGLAMRGLAASGRQAEALEMFERTRHRLADELGVDPGAELRAAHLAVVSAEPPPAAWPRSRPKGNVRKPRTSFIGREAELGRLTDLLGRDRLVTLVGPGGAGKTRLATEAALRLAPEPRGPVTEGPGTPAGEAGTPRTAGWRDGRRIVGEPAGEPVAESRGGWPAGAWMVELGPVSEPAGVPGAVLDALGLRDDRPGYRPPEEARDVVEQVAEALGGRPLLVVLDNCEHVVTAAAVLVERLLDECPALRVLATSREPLNVPGERLVPLPPLEPPPVGAGADEATAYPSVRLLVDRAAAARPSFAVDDENAAAVVALCRRLDGMPLAIELAAARLRTMTPRQLADRLDDRFRLLDGGSRTALPRQQTLRAVVEWSWDLLDEGERVLARRLGVFADSATLEAVEEVCGGTADVLGALADKSLVRVSPEGRYSMLETIRAYALERLAEAGETAEYRDRHALHLLDLAERAVPELRTARQVEWIERLAAERDDFAAALRWLIDRGDAGPALRLCGALNWYWWMCGYRRESAAWAVQALDLAGDTPPPGLAAAYTACMFAYGIDMFGTISNDRAAMTELSTRMDALVERAVQEGPVHPLLLISRVVMAAAAGRDEQAAALLGEYAGSDDLWLSSAALMIGGRMRSASERERELEQAVEGFRRLGDRWGLSEALLGLADLRAERGAPTDDLIAETWSLTSEWVSDDESISTLIRLAQVRLRVDDLDGAGADLALARARVGEETSPWTLVLLGLGEAAYETRRGDLDRSLAIYRDMSGAVAAAPQVPQLTAMYLTSYGRVLARAGDLEAALARHRQALDVLGHVRPDRPLLSMTLAGFALAAQAAGDQERAAVLFGGASAFVPQDTSPETAQGRAAAEKALGEELFGRRFAEGAALSLDDLHSLVGGTT
ncbi:BTAD domain-containing putative transcriptional regulator [Nonomuraea sp. NPDC049607]|uniref:BTAD domain-containing putative transcriptional regulator n=1 Tax=Nonomuraea sp. NPDC049607 TaxID=3154732 RepID=UPI0034462465